MSPSLISILLPTGEVLASRALTADTMLSRMKGLLGRRRLEADEALILPRCNAVHTWGMRFPIDAVFVDRAWAVVAIWKALLPWRMTPFVRRAQAVIELPAGAAQRAQLEVGDRLVLKAVSSQNALDKA